MDYFLKVEIVATSTGTSDTLDIAGLFTLHIGETCVADMKRKLRHTL